MFLNPKLLKKSKNGFKTINSSPPLLVIFSNYFFRHQKSSKKLDGITSNQFPHDLNSLKYTGGPCISRFHNSWSPLFFDLVSGTKFVKSLPFRDFEKKFVKKKNQDFFRKFWYLFKRNPQPFLLCCVWWLSVYTCYLCVVYQ